MPLYEYQCNDCDQTFEKLVFNDQPSECPECHGKHIERLLSVPAKPQSAGSALPMACKSSGPPCGPQCPRF